MGKRPKIELHREFKKMKTPTYDGETKEVIEGWFLNINRYFQVYDYSIELKSKMVTYQLHGKAS